MKVNRLRVKFVNVCEWFDRCDRLKIIFKSKKNKITKLYFILKIIKNYHYISLVHRRKKLKVTYFNKKYLKDNVIRIFIIKNYFLKLIL